MVRKKKNILWIVIFIILCIPAVWMIREGFAIWKDVQKQKAEDRQILLDLSQRLNVEADWDVITKYLYCDALYQGMSTTDVENVLEKIGPYYPPYTFISGMLEINFQNASISRRLSPLHLIFSQGNLRDWSFGENFLGTIPECE